ncbi:hypothetical protein SUDANB121_05532 [Nocardiopsis dassonvillei]|uniref:hypothetical protein n=1 Tax=Nocardiopsis dassonvillei TaxID=2014 RepID=UPI003F55AEEC
MAAHVWALTAALLATALAALFISRRADRKPRIPPATPERTSASQRGDLLADQGDRADDDPDQIAGALVRPYLNLVPRPLPAEPEDYPAAPPEPAEEEFAELAERIRTYLALRT